MQYPGVSITKRQFPFIFTKAYEISCKMETVKSSFWATGIWPTNRTNVYHNLFNPSKAYQSLEATNNSENDVVNFNAKSENDVNNRLLQSTNLKARDCPLISTDNQAETKNNPQNFLHEISSQQGELSVICGPSTQQLVPPKQFIAESGTGINSEQLSPGKSYSILYHKWLRKALFYYLEEIQALEKIFLPQGHRNHRANIPFKRS